MSKHLKLIVVAAALCIIGGAYSLVFANGAVEQRATLSGVVLADGLVQNGAKVAQGQVLVKIKSIAGAAPAARANIAGTVTAVLVQPGQNIKAGQVVVKLAQ